MTLGPIAFGAPTEARLDDHLARAAHHPVTYSHVGSTLTAAAGRYERSVELGSAPGTFERAVEGIRAWACHAGIGATIHPPRPPIEVGTDLLVVLPIGPWRMLVPDRIVAVVDEPDRFGFAYGTLPGHPERGEEGFWIERSADGAVRATIRVEATGAWLLARIGAPVVTAFQRVALQRYLRGLQRFVDVGA